MKESTIREIVTAIAGIVAAHGFVNDNIIQIVLPLFIALITMIAGIVSNVGPEKIFTLARKTLSLLPGALMALGWITPEASQAWLGFLTPVLAVIWASYGKVESNE